MIAVIALVMIVGILAYALGYARGFDVQASVITPDPNELPTSERAYDEWQDTGGEG